MRTVIGELRADLANHRALLRDVAHLHSRLLTGAAREVVIDRKTWDALQALDQRNP